MAQQASMFKKRISRTVKLDYWLSLPQGYGADPQQKWPLILFLHGAGERGDDLQLVKKNGIAKVLEQRADFPFIAVSPQCPERTAWSEKVDALSALLDDIAARYAVDTDRVYLTGLSMGGYGTWHLAAAHPERFAAIAPICGGAAWYLGLQEDASPLKDVPTWAFHGAKDRTVPLRESQSLVDALKACGGDVRFTVYPEAGHDSWTETYDNPELYTWFLQHSLRDRARK